MTKVFVEQPLALPGSANQQLYITISSKGWLQTNANNFEEVFSFCF